MLQSGEHLWMVPYDLAIQARNAQRKAQDKKDPSKDKKSVSCYCLSVFFAILFLWLIFTERCQKEACEK